MPVNDSFCPIPICHFLISVMVKKSNEEPADKAAERLKQLYNARFPAGSEEQTPLPDKDTAGPAKKKAAKKTSSKKKKD